MIKMTAREIIDFLLQVPNLDEEVYFEDVDGGWHLIDKTKMFSVTPLLVEEE